MNGSSMPIPQLAMANPVVQLLESFLAEAKAGRISTVAIVAAPPQGGFGSSYAGPQRGDLYIGAHSLANKIMRDIETPAKVSPIIRATMNG
jgi:hypothetical protein